MIAAQRASETAQTRFEQAFEGQYRLSKTASPSPPDEWVIDHVQGWHLVHCPSLPSCTLLDAQGIKIGWLLGYAVGADGQLVGPDLVKLKRAYSDDTFWDYISSELTWYAGKYTAILITPNGGRAYFDPVVDLPAVFNHSEHALASSPLMALSTPLRVNPRIKYPRIRKRGGNYGMGQTCDIRVMRVRGNHYLDLDSFAQHRYWPLETDSFEQENELPESARIITTRLGEVTGALLANYDCLMPLTGGNDSRTLAFSARKSMYLAKACYSHRTNYKTGVDSEIGAKLAHALGHELHQIDALSAIETNQITETEISKLRQNFYLATGYQNAPSDAELVAGDMLPEGQVVLRGNVLDLTRANQWPRDCKFYLGHGIDLLAIGTRSAEENRVYWASEYQEWAKTLPTGAQFFLYDFAFMELQAPCTLGARLQGYPHAAYVNPFNDRRMLAECIRTPTNLRKKGLLNAALHAACEAPEIPMLKQVLRSQRAQ